MKTKPLREHLDRAWQFLSEDVWDVDLASLPSLRATGVRAVRVIQLVFKGFRDDECPLHASALTFSTLMSVVPVLALSLALAKGFGDTATAKNRIRSAISEWTGSFSEEPPAAAVTNVPPLAPGAIGAGAAATGTAATVSIGGTNVAAAASDATLTSSQLAREIEALVDDLFAKVENISFAALGGIGLALLLWMVIQVLGRVEASFNNVWGVAEGRTLWRRFTDYTSVLIVFPLLAIAASSVSAADVAGRYLEEPAATWVRVLLGSGALKTLSVLMLTSLTFTFFIMFMPHARVKPVPGLAGGTVVAVLFIAWLRLCSALQVGVARYGKIYGSFAVVPIILFWVYISWQIILFGAEVAFAVQNCGTYRMEQGSRRADVRSRLLLALAIAAEAGRAMLGGGQRFEPAAFARRRRVPVRFLNEIVDELVQAGLLAEIADGKGAYVLLRAPDRLPLKDVIDVVMRSGVAPARLGLGRVDPAVERALEQASEGMGRSLEQTTVQQLIEKEAASPAG